MAALKSIYRAGWQSEWSIGCNLLAQRLLPYIFWISQGGFLSFDRTVPRRFEHATPSLSWSEGTRLHSSNTVTDEFTGS